MHENPRRTVLAGGLAVVAALIFGAGIDWGLPSHAVDPILFGSGEGSAAHQLDSFHLTGVGISRLAGAWEDASNLAADVASHPIADRSQAVTLLENPHLATASEIIQQGDQALAALVAAADAADQKYSALRMGSDDAAADKARQSALDDQEKVHRYVEAYNLKNFGDQSETIARDQVNRARILRRYQLYSYQPDEMISFRALGKMHPANLQFDPMLYQYGGLWIYPLGAIVKAASLVGFVTASSDPTFYLDSPEVFGRLYILGRAYSAAWGIVAGLAVFAIARRSGGGSVLAVLAALCFVCLPVVVDLAHEAKPHLAGTALMLLAILAARKYIETWRWKWIAWTAIACGACAGMILSGILSLVLLPVMSILRRDPPGRIVAVCVAGVLISAAVYFAANPYVAIHLVGDRTVLESNLSNSEAMYAPAPGVGTAVRLVAAGVSWPIAVAGIIGLIAVLRAKPAGVERGFIWLLAVPAAIGLVQFSLFAGGKPGEYGRFAAFADAALMLAAFMAIARISKPPIRILAGLLLVASAAVYSAAYERGFLRDSTPDNSRTEAASAIDAQHFASEATPTLLVKAEPAPYCLPPVNLFRWRVVLLPKEDGTVAPGDLLVTASEPTNVFDPSETPISWADKSFTVAPIGVK